MTGTEKTHTHTAYAFRREGKKFGRWLEIGIARTDENGITRVLLDRLPTGGFTGSVHLYPLGTTPSDAQPRPQRPGRTPDDEEDSED